MIKDGSLDEESLDAALEYAEKDYINDICTTVLNALSDGDRRFLMTMTDDKKCYKVSEIAGKLDARGDYEKLYKKRLIDAGVICQPRRGEVMFVVPYLKEYLIDLE